MVADRHLKVPILAPLFGVNLLFSATPLIKSIDGGRTWIDIDPGPAHQGIVDLQIAGSWLYALTVTRTEAPPFDQLRDFSVLSSDDGGRTWRVLDPLGVTSGLAAMATASSDPKTVYLTRGGLSRAVTVLTIDATDSSILYAATEGFHSEPIGFRGLFKSMDKGVSWFAVNNGLEGLIDTRFRMTALVIDRDNPGHLYTRSAGGGVFRSTDGGGFWEPFNKGLGNLDIRVLALAPSKPKALYAGTPSGVFKITDDEGTNSDSKPLLPQRPRRAQ
jgi:photosystem II stability/assembly factor-like uncharacterized protein